MIEYTELVEGLQKYFDSCNTASTERKFLFLVFDPLNTVADIMMINVKKTTVYTHVNGDRRSHVENSKNKKVILL